MNAFCCGLIAGCLSLLFWPQIPPFNGVWLLLCLPLLCCLRYWFFAGLLLSTVCALGAVQQHQDLSRHLLQAAPVWLSGHISSMVQPGRDYSRLQFQLETPPYQGYSVRLGWSQAPELLGQGQRWQLQLRCKRVRPPANPGSAPVEANAYVLGILASCQVRQALLLESGMAQRQLLYNSWQQRFGDWPGFALITALTLGERPFSSELWLGLQASALGHLISISGFHIGLLFGWLVLLSNWLALVPGGQGLRRFGPWLALAAACYYSVLAGLAIPTLRAVLALALGVLLWALRRRLSPSQAWLRLCGLLLLLQPLWVLSLSFWLTLTAVALLLLLVWRYPLPRGNLAAKLGWAVRFQCWMTLLMAVPTLLFFHGVAPLALVSNLLFVPWCSLLLIPWLFLAVLIDLLGPAHWLWHWQLADLLTQPLLHWLLFTASTEHWWLLPAQTVSSVLALLVLMVLLCFGWQRRRALAFALVLLMPALSAGRFAQPQTALHLLDVGQGTALLVQQGRRGLLYDVGPRYGDFSATEAYVLPYLHYQGIQQLDYLVLSHADADHTGNYQQVLQAYPDAALMADFPAGPAQESCLGLPARWGEARLNSFRAERDPASNDGSCWLRLDWYGWSFLATGDSGQAVELQYLAQQPGRVHVLLLGHHGSNSSSGLEFLTQLSPLLALNSAGALNHYVHPHPAVRARLALLQIPLVDTGQLGAIELRYSAGQIDIWPYRQRLWPLWLRNSPATNASMGITAETAE